METCFRNCCGAGYDCSYSIPFCERL